MRLVGVAEGTFQLQSRGHREVLFLASEELTQVQEVGRHYALGCWKGILCGCLGGCLGWLVLGALVATSAAYPNPVPALGFGLGAFAGVLLGALRTRVTFLIGGARRTGVRGDRRRAPVRGRRRRLAPPRHGVSRARAY
ncbi:MAG: hypothetical protein AAFZ65_03135 [Planctomycetota bacterium]